MPRRKPRYQREAEQAAADQSDSAKFEQVPGRIPADIAEQAPHNSYSGGPLYYEDREFTCKDCGKVEVWTAEQQKWWYETAKGYIFSDAVRCRECRQAKRDSHAGTPRRSHQERREQSDAS